MSETKRCSMCKKDFPLSEYHTNKEHSDGLGSRCKACCRIANFESKRRLHTKYGTINARLEEAFGSIPCLVCDGVFAWCAMDFDHVIGVKAFGIGDRGMNPASPRAMRAIRSELLKCELVCSNCHRVRTFKRGRGIDV